MRRRNESTRLGDLIRCSCIISLLLLNIFPVHSQVAFALYKPGVANQQTQADVKVTIQARKEKLSAVLERIEKQTDFVFVYSNDEINAAQKVSITVKDKEISSVVAELFTPLNISYEFLNDKIILKPVKKGTAEKRTVAGFTIEARDIKLDNEKPAIDITGRVTNDNGTGISNVSVTLKGTDLGTVTNSDGAFTLRVPDDRADAVLVFSSVGFTTQEVSISGKTTIAVQLVSELKDLGEVVVIGYGTQRRSSVTGSVDAVGKKAIEGRPVTNLSTALQGTSPNLIIQQKNFEPGQGVNINIRGLGTLGNNTPLVVIDGIIGGDINLLNPNDIESVSVLKDAGSAAIYGSRSANGVLLVTTKKGKKNEKATVTYSGIYGIQAPRITYKQVHAWENAYFKNLSLVNSGLAPAFTPSQIQEFAARGDGDWSVANIVENAPQQSHTISISGGSATNTYLISFGYLDQQNNFVGPNYGYKRYNVRLNQTAEIGKLKVNTVLSYVKVNGKDHAFNSSFLIVDAGRAPLYYSYTDSAGNYLTNPVVAQFSPKAVLEKGGFRRSNDDEIFGNLNAELSITRDLKLKGVFGGTVRSNNGFSRVTQINFLPGGVWGDDRAVGDNNYKSLFTNLQLLAEYTKQIKEHDIKVLVGASNESFKGESFGVVKTFTDPNLGVPGTGTIVSPTGSFNSINGTSENSINSLFGRAGYSFNNIYFAEVNFRYDGSSKFAEDNRWGFFPSAAVAWRITEEKFMHGIREKVGDIKLRSSYGILGNQNVGDYQYQTSFFNYANAYGFNNGVVGGAGFSLGNPDLTWEKAATFNVGVDASFLNRRLEVSFDYFNKTTSDILYTRQDVPQLFGAGFPDYNVAKVRNRGWELKTTYNLPGKIFNQSFSVNLADNLNELLELTSGATEQVFRKEEFELVRRVGQPITVYRGFKRDGYYQNLDDVKNGPTFANGVVGPGDIRYVDRNGDGRIDDNDKFILGNPFPRYTFGFTYTLAVKGFDVLLFIQGVGKRDQMIRGEQVEPFHVGYAGSMYEHQRDFWTPTNPDAQWPRLAENGSASNANNYKPGSDLYLFDASYARLKNLQVGYTIPQRITKKAAIQRARIYFTGQNLFTLSKLKFLDPENSEFDSNTNPNTGANSARAYFMPVFYGGGIDITF